MHSKAESQIRHSWDDLFKHTEPQKVRCTAAESTFLNLLIMPAIVSAASAEGCNRSQAPILWLQRQSNSTVSLHGECGYAQFVARFPTDLRAFRIEISISWILTCANSDPLALGISPTLLLPIPTVRGLRQNCTDAILPLYGFSEQIRLKLISIATFEAVHCECSPANSRTPPGRRNNSSNRPSGDKLAAADKTLPGRPHLC